jgi:hypothetical protein
MHRRISQCSNDEHKRAMNVLKRRVIGIERLGSESRYLLKAQVWTKSMLMLETLPGR